MAKYCKQAFSGLRNSKIGVPKYYVELNDRNINNQPIQCTVDQSITLHSRQQASAILCALTVTAVLPRAKHDLVSFQSAHHAAYSPGHCGNSVI